MTESNDKELERLLQFLRDYRGFDFTGYKRSTLERRIQKRMHENQLDDYSSYMDLLEVDPGEFSDLFNTILINVTAFFRDKAAWDYLEATVIPQILEVKKEDEPIRIWCAGCSSGEEAYSLAILFAEALGEEMFLRRVKIYATDVDEEALDQARSARYASIKNIPENWVAKYFVQSQDSFQFRKDLRRQLIFGRHDLVQDAPISKLDLLSCRNTLMYLNSETQTRILSQLHFALKETGFLFVGKAEMLLTRTHFFLPDHLKHRIFRKTALSFEDRKSLEFLSPENNKPESDMDQQVILWEGALNAIDLAAMIIDNEGTLLMANKALQELFNIDERDIGRPFHELELSYRPVDLRSLIDQAYKSKKTERLQNIEYTSPSRQIHYLDIRVVPLPLDGPNILGVGITLTDTTSFFLLQEQLQLSNQTLETTNEELQSSNEELETTNEELQSTNEELETTNEELQSTNEELETMNEELQSTNEEFEALNTELEHRTRDINLSNQFLNSILASLESVVIVLDNDLEVTGWNESAEEIWGLRKAEVVGVPFLSLDCGLPVEIVAEEIKKHPGDQKPFAFELDAINRRGQSMHCEIVCSSLMHLDTRTGFILMINYS